uniref:uncharacterized serine-rich protein C215.13-like n=1 Tax=Monopterus albus TaxID=43700 RepID=UPI0009B43AD0|nr:uncharacterized serine-rich protein C215.13-like [Monopterus albus]
MGPKQTSPPHPDLQTTVSLNSPSHLEPLGYFHQALPQTTPSQTLGQGSFPQTDQSQSEILSEASSISSQPLSQSNTPHASTSGWKQSQPSVTPRSFSPLLFTLRVDPVVTLDEGKEITDVLSPAKIKTMSPVSVFAPLATPSPSYFSGSTYQSTLHSSSSTSDHTLLASSLVHHSSTTPPYPSTGSPLVSMHPSIKSKLFTHSSSSSVKDQPKTAPAISALTSPSPISVPPNFPSDQPSSTSPVPSSLASSLKSLNSSNYPSPAPLFSPLPLSTSSSSPFTSSQYITGSTFSSTSSSTISPVLSSSIVSGASSLGFATSPRSPPPSSSSTSTPATSLFPLGSSYSSNSSATSSSSMSSTTMYPGPSPAPRRSLHNPSSSSLSPAPSHKVTVGQRLLIQNHMASSNPKTIINSPTLRAVIHPNHQPDPSLKPNFKLNIGHELKPNLPNSETKPKRPSNPSGTPDKEEKYPDIIPRHSAWELGMLLGSSAGLGMVLVVGIRYMYRQACHKQTEMTLNDREREYGRGERGLIHVQECGDLVRVRRIRENSFVLLAEYDILASPGD